jgi:putative membrane protein
MNMTKNTLTIFSTGLGVPLLLLFWLYFVPRPENPPLWAAQLASINAILNSICVCFLVSGYIAIRLGKKAVHIKCMMTAILSSFLFLISYLTYHHFHGDSKFGGEGTIRTVYFFILISHILLSIVNFPMILVTLSLAFNKSYERHKKWAVWTFPIWLYVSVTGVVIYFMLKAHPAS